MANNPSKEKLYSLQEVAKILRVSDRSVFRYIESRKLRATKIGYWRISEVDLTSFIMLNENIRKELWLKENADFVKPNKKTKKKK